MDERGYQQLQDSAAENKLLRELHKKQEAAKAAIAEELVKMEQAQRVLRLTDDEMAMLRSYRRFLTQVRKDGQVFRWQVRKPEPGQILKAQNEIGSLIKHPQDLSAV